MTLLLDRYLDITVTEAVVKAVAGNQENGKEVMTLFVGSTPRHHRHKDGS
jgi:hypothetical protein